MDGNKIYSHCYFDIFLCRIVMRVVYGYTLEKRKGDLRSWVRIIVKIKTQLTVFVPIVMNMKIKGCPMPE